MAKYTNIEKLLQKVNKDLEDVRTEFYKGLATKLVEASYHATDTGAYMASHNIGTDTKRVGYKSKEGDFKARFVDKASVADQALSRLHAEAEAVPEGAEKVYISNRSPHAKAVEDGGHNWKYTQPYFPFKIMRREAGRIMADVVKEIKGRSQ